MDEYLVSNEDVRNRLACRAVEFEALAEILSQASGEATLFWIQRSLLRDAANLYADIGSSRFDSVPEFCGTLSDVWFLHPNLDRALELLHFVVTSFQPGHDHSLRDVDDRVRHAHDLFRVLEIGVIAPDYTGFLYKRCVSREMTLPIIEYVHIEAVPAPRP